jgi:flagellar basal-body rod protein FlgG
MLHSLFIGASGLQAQQLYVDNIANNLANINTDGFKRSKIEFHDLMYQSLKEPGTPTSETTQTPVGLEVGLGVRVAANQKVFTQGNMNETQRDFDLAIAGEGFFQIMNPDGGTSYRRSGIFNVDRDGVLVTAEGGRLEPEIVIPEDAADFTVDQFGVVRVTMVGDTTATEIGQLELGRFINPAGLKALGGGLFQETSASGVPIVDLPGTNKMGTINQGFVEGSNVNVVEEMTSLITAQRAYEIMSKVVQGSEEMLQIANQLKR